MVWFGLQRFCENGFGIVALIGILLMEIMDMLDSATRWK